MSPSRPAAATAAREAAKLVADRVLWGRVALQRRIEGPGRVAARPMPSSVAPTGVLGSRQEWERAVTEVRRLRLPLHPDQPKNWDASGAVRTVLEHAGRDARVLDAGSSRYSPVLAWLRLYGLRDLLGINLEFGREFRRDGVTYRHGDVTATGLPDASTDAVTCLSVIEHGVALRPFFTETARVLRPGGVLSVSTDYAREPPDTSGLRAYGVPVRVFSRADLRAMLEIADEVGFDLIGELDPEHLESPVHWRRMGLRFTFALLGLRRR